MRRLSTLALSGSVSLLALSQALAQAVPTTAPENIGAVEGTATAPVNPALPPVPATANQFAPTSQPLDAIQPTSVISAQTLTKIAVPTDDYNDVILLTPSATDISPAGPGLQQDFGQSIRGLQYTQFTVDWDGIPVPGFPFNLAPQPGAYFLARDFASVTVNRGPGQASAIGQATFGGYTELQSQDPLQTAQVEPYGTFGSFGTKFYGVEANTGTIAQTGGTRVLLDLTREEATGADTGISTERRNLFFKLEQPIGDNTVVTYAMNADNDVTKTPYGATLQSISLYGRNFNFNRTRAASSSPTTTTTTTPPTSNTSRSTPSSAAAGRLTTRPTRPNTSSATSASSTPAATPPTAAPAPTSANQAPTSRTARSTFAASHR